MSGLDIAYGYVRKDTGEAFLRYADPSEDDYYSYRTFTELVSAMRRKYGPIQISTHDSWSVHEFAFTVYDKPF